MSIGHAEDLDHRHRQSAAQRSARAGTVIGVGRFGLLLVAAVLVASCATSSGVRTIEADPIDSRPTAPDTGGPDTGGPGTTGLDWQRCDDAAGLLPPFDCATLEVPLDHADPDGATIEIAVNRLATADTDDRIGSLVFNPGGPGASGIDLLTAVAPVVPAELADRFDLVGFDPRGVGASSAIDCDIDFDDDIDLLDAGDDAGWAALVAEAEAGFDDCTPDTADLAPFVGTDNAARDLDLLRAALGDDTLSYVGFSYGTRLGATYAELFPDRVRALVLDGAVTPTDDLTEIALGQGPGFDIALERFAAACDGDPDCPFGDVGPDGGDSVGDTLEVYASLVEEIDEVGTLPTDAGDRVLTAGELRLGVLAALYSTQLWPVLADALFVAETVQDGSLLQVLADTYLGRQPDGSYDDSQVAGSAINCADEPRRPPVAEVRIQSEAAAASSEYFGDLLRAGTGCIGTPDPVDPITIGPAEGAAPILVIGTTGDPATPYEWAVELADFLASGELYTVEGDGHTAFLSIACVDDVVVGYLVDLELPEPGSSCGADTATAGTVGSADDVFAPSGEGELDAIVALFDCLRDNGLDLPEISVGDLLADPTGEELLDALDPSDPAFAEAIVSCEELIPGL